MAIPALHGNDDTIVAQATAPGPAALAIVRLSGQGSAQLLRRLAPAARPHASHRMHRATLRDGDGAALDDAMVVTFLAPHSYTGEEMIELYLHGGVGVVEAVVAACVAAGARAALPGEFTQRAMLHGRLDLSQVEAVADLLHAGGGAERQAALAQLRGGLRDLVDQWLAPLESILAAWRAALDFPDDDTGDGIVPGQQGRLKEVAEALGRLRQQMRVRGQQGRLLVLCGAPNVGKSTLLNAWAGETRVLVDGRAGTTRDPVEVRVGLAGGDHLLVCDTAGLRQAAAAPTLAVAGDGDGDAAAQLEALGMAQSRRWAQRADCCLWLLAGDAPQMPPPDLAVHAAVGTKADLIDAAARKRIEQTWAVSGLPFWGWISAARGVGVGELLSVAQQQLTGGVSAAAEGTPLAATWVRQRHQEAVMRAEQHLKSVLVGLSQQQPLDMLAYDLQLACAQLGSIVGRDVDAAVFEQVFADFCVGK